MKNQFAQKKTGNINNRLGKEEILRGHLIYSIVIRDSVKIRTDYLKVYIIRNTKENRKTDSPDIIESPLLTKNVKVGFIIAKKKIRKAVLRNRIRRLMRESYRLNRIILNEPNDLSIIFSLNDEGYILFKKDPKIKFGFMEAEVIKALEKINKYFKEK